MPKVSIGVVFQHTISKPLGEGSWDPAAWEEGPSQAVGWFEDRACTIAGCETDQWCCFQVVQNVCTKIKIIITFELFFFFLQQDREKVNRTCFDCVEHEREEHTSQVVQGFYLHPLSLPCTINSSQNKKYKPLDLRPKKTKKERLALSIIDRRRKTARQKKILHAYPMRKYYVKV